MKGKNQQAVRGRETNKKSVKDLLAFRGISLGEKKRRKNEGKDHIEVREKKKPQLGTFEPRRVLKKTPKDVNL